MQKKWDKYLGIFMISLAILLFQISLTRIFSLILFSNYAFMIISTALFGFGLSGVLLSVFPGILKRIKTPHILLFSAIGFAVTVLGSFLVINHVPLEMSDLKSIKNLLSLAIYYGALIVPFAFSGLIISALFTLFCEDIPKLYFFDLIGAGLGCLLTVPFFMQFGGLGTLYSVALLAILSGFIFSFRESRLSFWVSGGMLVLWILFYAQWNQQVIKVHDRKRSYKDDQQRNVIEYSKWSSLSKIDVAPGPKSFFKRLWIDGGTNESALIKFDGAFKTEYLAGMDRLLIALPYMIRKNPEVAIIGSSGGREVLLALNHDPRHITAIEMDPTICEVVSKTYAAFIGNIFSDPRVSLVCDEGRSYVRRSEQKFDIIHQVNNFTPIAMASGAINLSESYLLTVEAFNEYFSRLTDNGILALNRHNTFKIVVLAREVLERLGLNPEKHLVVIQGEDQLGNGFYMKKTPFSKEEITEIKEFAAERSLKMLYYPGIDESSNWYVRFLKSQKPESFYRLKGVNLEPNTDDKPFFEHIGTIGKLDLNDPEVPKGLIWADQMKKIKGMVPIEDLILIAVLLEAVCFSILFIFVPLIGFNKKGVSSLLEFKVLGYFFAVGLAFIIIEIGLMQKFVLFLGVPVYAIAVVLFALLSGTGLGALVSSRFVEKPFFHLRNMIFGLFSMLVLSNFYISWSMESFIGFPFWGRILIAVIMIFPLGFFMGMPFPLGMNIISRKEKTLIPWAWGINSFATVIGTVVAMFLARMIGFKMSFIMAGFIYILGFISLKAIEKNP